MATINVHTIIMKYILIMLILMMNGCSNTDNEYTDNNEQPKEWIEISEDSFNTHFDDEDVVTYSSDGITLYDIEYPFKDEIHNVIESDKVLFNNDFSIMVKDTKTAETVYMFFEDNNHLRVVHNFEETLFILDELPWREDIKDEYKEAYLNGDNIPLGILTDNRENIRIFLLNRTYGYDFIGVELTFKNDGLDKFIDEISKNTLLKYNKAHDESIPPETYFLPECDFNDASILIADNGTGQLLTDGFCNYVSSKTLNGIEMKYLSDDIAISDYIYNIAKNCIDTALLFDEGGFAFLMPLYYEDDNIIITSSKDDYPKPTEPKESIKDFKEYGLRAFIDDEEVDEIEFILDKEPHEIIFRDYKNNEYMYVYQEW